jgi:hypothetical protein
MDRARPQLLAIPPHRSCPQLVTPPHRNFPQIVAFPPLAAFPCITTFPQIAAFPRVASLPQLAVLQRPPPSPQTAPAPSTADPPPNNAPLPLPTVPSRRILRSVCLIRGAVLPDSETDGHLNIPPFKKRPLFDALKKRAVPDATEEERLKKRFKPWQKLFFVEEHDEHEFETERPFRQSTRAYRLSEQKISKALSSGEWRRHRKYRHLYVHVPSGRVLVRSDFVDIVTEDQLSPPAQLDASVR